LVISTSDPRSPIKNNWVSLPQTREVQQKITQTVFDCLHLRPEKSDKKTTKTVSDCLHLGPEKSDEKQLRLYLVVFMQQAVELSCKRLRQILAHMCRSKLMFDFNLTFLTKKLIPLFKTNVTVELSRKHFLQVFSPRSAQGCRTVYRLGFDQTCTDQSPIRMYSILA